MGEEEEEEEEEKKKFKQGQQGMETELKYATNLGYEFLYEFPYNCMVISCTLT